MERLNAALNARIPSRTYSEWRVDNEDREKERSKQYYEANKEKIKEYKTQWPQRNKESINEKRRQWLAKERRAT